MAFAFEVETGAGSPSSNSYVGLDEAETVAEENLRHRESWALMDDEERQRALVYATRILDASYIWNGKRAGKDQALAWPRVEVLDQEGDELPSDALPRSLRSATVFMAIHSIGNDPLSIESKRRLSSVSADGLKASFREDSFGVPTIVPDFVRYLLIGIGTAREAIRSARIIRT